MEPFDRSAADPDAVIWRLCLDRTGNTGLFYGEERVAGMASADAVAILRTEGNPAELAEEVIAELTAQLAIEMHEHARMSLEADLSRWIVENF